MGRATKSARAFGFPVAGARPLPGRHAGGEPQARLTGVVVMAFMPVVFFGGAVGALLAGMGWLGAAWQIQSRATMNSGPSSMRSFIRQRAS